MKTYISIILILITVSCFASIYSQKSLSIGTDFDSMQSAPVVLSGNTDEKTKTLIKITHTNNEIFIGVRCNDFNVALLDNLPYSKENPLYSKDRIEIEISKKGFLNISAGFLIYPGGIIYDAFNKNSNINNKYKVLPKITESGWEFVLIIDKKSLTNTSLAGDDWQINIIRKSHRSNIPTQFLGNNIFDKQDLYFSNDEEAFLNFEKKIKVRLNELKQNSENLPAELKASQDAYLAQINDLSQKKDRESIEKIKTVFENLSKEMIYYLGANEQSKINKSDILPFMYSFVSFNTKFTQNGLNSYVNKQENRLNLCKNEKTSFGIIISAYADIPLITCSYEGDFSDIIKIGFVDPVENTLDAVRISEKNELSFENIKKGESKLLYIDFEGSPKIGEFNGQINLIQNNIKTILPIKFNINNIVLPKNDNIIAKCDFGESFAKEIFKDTVDFSLYLKSVSKISSFLTQNNITSVTLDVANSPIWFDYKENEFGKWQAKGKNFDLTLKTLSLAGIKNVYIMPFDSLGNISKTKAFVSELLHYVAENHNINVYILADENNMAFKEYKDYKEILSPKVPVYEPNSGLISLIHPIEDTPGELRKNMSKIFLDNKNTKIIIPFTPQNLDLSPNATKTHQGTGINSIIYYSLIGNDIEIIPSLRLKTLNDGIKDLEYLSIFTDKITSLKKGNQSSIANEGDNMLKQYKDLVLIKSPELLTGNEFDSMKSKIIDYLKKYE